MNITPDITPQRPSGARTDSPSESTRQRWARLSRQMAEAEERARATALHEGHTRGWRHGVTQGLVIGLLAGAAAAALVLLAWAQRAGLM